MIKKINNTSSTLIINAFEGFYYDNSFNINIAKAQLEEKYHLDKLLSIARKISKTIKTEIMNKDVELRTGDKVKWNIGMGSQILMTGVVMEDLGNGVVDIITHSKNDVPFNMDLKVSKDKLKLIF